MTVTAPTVAYALPTAARFLPPGVAPEPVTLPGLPDPSVVRPYVPAVPLADDIPPDEPGGYLIPGSTAWHLCRLLDLRGVTQVIHNGMGDRAVVSLRGITVWITPHALTWTHDGHDETWPAGDLPGAADHLASLIYPAELPAPAGIPWEGDRR